MKHAFAVQSCCIALTLCNAVAAEPASVIDAPTDGASICSAAMTDTSLSQPRRLVAPADRPVVKGDRRPVTAALSAASPDSSRPIALACGVVRFDVAENGTVQNVKILATYPSDIGLDIAFQKFMKPMVYQASYAGGPYALNITIRSQVTMMRRPNGR